MRRWLGLLFLGVVVSPFYADSPWPVPSGAVSVTVDSSSTISSGGTLDHHGRAAVKRWLSSFGGDDRLVLIYRRATAHNATGAELEIRFSDDDGATWTAENTKLGGGAVTNFPMEPPVGDISFGLGWLMVTPNGALVINMTSANGTFGATVNDAYQSVSTDGGETWSSPAAVVGDAGLLGKTLGGNGDYIANGYVYTNAADPSDYTDWSPSATRIMRTNDDGATWDTIGTMVATTDISTGAFETGIVRVGTTRVLGVIRDMPHTNAYQRFSDDLGVTWGTIEDITSTAGILGMPRLYTRAWLKGQANWWKDPVVVMVGFVHQSPPSSQTRRNCVWVSRDHGATWSTPFYIDSTVEDAGYGDMFYDAGNDQYVVINYQGTLTAASLKQYRLSIAGI